MKEEHTFFHREQSYSKMGISDSYFFFVKQITVVTSLSCLEATNKKSLPHSLLNHCFSLRAFAQRVASELEL